MASRFFDGLQAAVKIFGIKSVRQEFADLRADTNSALEDVADELDGLVGVDAAQTTDDNGGAVSLAGGVADGTGTGGLASVAGGASEGASGTAGSVGVDAGNPNGGTAGTVTVAGTHAIELLLANASCVTTLLGLAEYADDAAAKGGGLTTGQLYRTSTGVVMVVLA